MNAWQNQALFFTHVNDLRNGGVYGIAVAVNHMVCVFFIKRQAFVIHIQQRFAVFKHDPARGKIFYAPFHLFITEVHINDLAHAFEVAHCLFAVDDAASRGDHRAFDVKREHRLLLRLFKFGNAFFVNERHALAASLELAFPFASPAIGNISGANGSLNLTPALTYSYTINPSLMVACQPQYTFSAATGPGYIGTSQLTVRIFLAKFCDSGFYFVIEPRPIYDFKAKRFDMIVSPIVGTTLGGGYAVALLAEIPVQEAMFRSRGAMYLFALTRTF